MKTSFALTPILLAALASAAQAQETVTVRIGQVGPTSGPAAHLGLDNINGVRLAVDDLNARGITLGGRKARFEVVAEDDAGDPRQGTQVAQKLCDQKVNGVVGHLFSGSTIPASRIYNDCGIPQISPVATNAKLTEQGHKLSFRLIANDNATGKALADYAARNNIRKVAVVDDRTAYGQGLVAVFKKTAQSLGIQVVDEPFTTDKAVDFSPILTSIKSKGAEAVFYGGVDVQAGPMLRQMQSLGLGKVKLFGGDGICTPRLAELAGSPNNVANVVCGEGGTSLEKMNGGVEWKKRYDARFAGQYQGNAPYGYDAVMVLAEAMKKAGSADPKVYGPQLASTDYAGITGQIAFDASGELKNPTLTLLNFREGKRVPLN